MTDPHNGDDPPPYPSPAGYDDPGSAAAGYPQPGYPQPDYPQPDYPQPDYVQQGYPQQAYPQPGYPPQEYPPQEYPPSGYPPPGYPPPGYPPPGYPQPGYWAPPRPTNGMAVASMVLGILWLYWLGSILALVFGYAARKQIRERGESGDGMAIAGIVLGWVGVGVLSVLLILLIIGVSTVGWTEFWD